MQYKIEKVFNISNRIIVFFNSDIKQYLHKKATNNKGYIYIKNIENGRNNSLSCEIDTNININDLEGEIFIFTDD